MSARALRPGAGRPPSSAARAAAGRRLAGEEVTRGRGDVALVVVQVEVHRPSSREGRRLVVAGFRRQAEHPLAEDVAQHLVGAAGDRDARAARPAGAATGRRRRRRPRRTASSPSSRTPASATSRAASVAGQLAGARLRPRDPAVAEHGQPPVAGVAGGERRDHRAADRLPRQHLPVGIERGQPVPRVLRRTSRPTARCRRPRRRSRRARSSGWSARPASPRPARRGARCRGCGRRRRRPR